MEGPTKRTIPAVTFLVCTDCVHLKKTAGLRSRFEHRNTFDCVHPEFAGKSGLFGKDGRNIHFNYVGLCDTPSWCPLLKKKSND